MRKCRHYIAVLAVASLAIAGCNKFENFGWLSGDAIKFGAGTQGDALTKTAYGDITTQTVSGETKKIHQMIDWQEGDVIRITCAQASTSENDADGNSTRTFADYKTSAGTRYGTTTESRATLTLNDNNKTGLRWGSESVAHTFYGVYPSPYVKSGDSLTDGGSLTGAIPEVQSPISVSGTADYVASPDMTNQYMVAKRTVKQKDFNNNEVFLYFTPITTAIEFEVTNAMTEDLSISSIELISTSYNLSGTFTTSLTGLNETGASYSNYPTVTAATGAKKDAAVSFGTTGLTLGANKKLTFTIFLLPEDDLNDLTFRINKVGGGYIQTALKTDASTWLSFGRCKKHFVKGLFADDGAKWGMGPLLSNWIPQTSSDTPVTGADLALEASLVPWENGGGSDVNLINQFYYDFCLGTTYVESNVKTEKTFENTTSASPATYIDIYSKRKQGQAGTPQDYGWKILSYRIGDGASVNVNGTSFNAGGLQVSANTTSNQLSITAEERTGLDKGSNSYWRNNTSPARTDNLDWSPADWSGYGAIDLSKYDYESDTRNAHQMTTANCYIIRHAGTYRIPLVYGNGVVYGVENNEAFSPGDRPGPGPGPGPDASFLNKFKHHLDKEITNPFIENNTKDGKKLDKNRTKALTATDKAVVWQSTAGVISNLSVTPATAPALGKGNMYTAGNVRYLEFEVNQDAICQGNAVLAVKDAGGKIMWSWHIWITNDPAVGDPAIYHNSYGFFPMNDIGWVEGALYPERQDVTIYLEQTTSGKIVEVIVSQPEVTAAGGGMFYQWGRKDPMRASGNTIVAGPKELSEAIKNPQTFYTISSSGDWCSKSYTNLWTGKENSTDANVETNNMYKTIYDPSPVGYKVPGPKAFAGFTSDDIAEFFMPTGYDDRKTGVKGDAGGLYFWTSITDSSTDRGRSFKGSLSAAAAAS
ncbi:MAG: hypothetical protein MJY84_05250, partial [Bacteroidales bacterium]|nr:hypothetical protein [Bacteroidales bacterium]